MAQVAIFEEKVKRWVRFDEDTEVFLEYLDKSAARVLNKDVDKIVARTGSDWQKIWEQKVGEKTVFGWRHIDQKKNPDHPGILLPGGAPLHFSAENRDLMMRSCREFSMFVGSTTIDASIFLEQQQEAEERVEAKND